MIDQNSTLVDVAFAICTKLTECGFEVVLVGGSAATYYAPDAYQSADVDFVAFFSATEENTARLVAAMHALGYDLEANMFRNRNGNPFTVEFPKGPLGIGGEYVTKYEKVKRDLQTLNVVSATDCIRDRLCAYYFWNDRSSLLVAVDIALAAADKVDMQAIRDWSSREQESRKFDDFVRLLESKRGSR